jgi:hypothetical protein
MRHGPLPRARRVGYGRLDVDSSAAPRSWQPPIADQECGRGLCLERRCRSRMSIRFYGGDEALVVEALLVELGELLVGLGDDRLTLGVGLEHYVHSPPH